MFAEFIYSVLRIILPDENTSREHGYALNVNVKDVYTIAKGERSDRHGTVQLCREIISNASNV